MNQKIKAFEEWVDYAFEFAMQCLDVSSGETVLMLELSNGEMPFMVIEHQGEEGPEDVRQVGGREIVSNDKTSLSYALIWPALMEGVEDEPIDVVIVEAANRKGQSAIVAQPYVLAESEDALLEPAGERVLVSEEGSLWTGKWGNDLSNKSRVPANIRVKPPDPETDTALEDLAYGAIKYALNRMQEGNEIPFVCLIDPGDAETRILGPHTLPEGGPTTYK